MKILPAWKAGVLSGDKIVQINGKSIKDLTLAEISQKMKGKRGTKITLGIMREDLDKPVQIEVIRDVVKIDSVKYEDLKEGYVYLRVISFMQNTQEMVKIFFGEA